MDNYDYKNKLIYIINHIILISNITPETKTHKQRYHEKDREMWLEKGRWKAVL